MMARTFSFALLLVMLPAVAQEPVVAKDPGGQALPASRAAATPPVTVTLMFAGGTLAEFCAQLRQLEPRANIVVAPLAADAKLPSMALRGAGLEQALEGACAVAESRALIRMKEFRGPGEPVFTILAQEPTMGGGASRPGPAGPSGPSSAAATAAARTEASEVFSLNRLLDAKDGFPVTTVLSAIEAATGGEQALAMLRFHKDSGLLIVRGRQEQMALVRDVLANLERDVLERRKQEHARKGAASEPTKDGK